MAETQTEPINASYVPVQDRPVFIIGAPRSGTTIVARSLDKHSAFWSAGESHLMRLLYGDGRFDQAWQQLAGQSSYAFLSRYGVSREELLRYLGIGLNALFTTRSQQLRWIEKTPEHTLMVDVLADMFPDALFLHILRDGPSVVTSMVNFLNRPLTQPKVKQIDEREQAPWSTDFGIACRTWRHYVDTAMGFCDQHPERCLTVRYDALTREPEETFSAIFRFLDVEYEEAPARHLRMERVNSSFVKYSRDNASLPPPPDPWQTWTMDQKRAFLSEAGEAMVKYGLVSEEQAASMEDETRR